MSQTNELTLAQVKDLVTYYLGSPWSADTIPETTSPCCIYNVLMDEFHYGRSWRQAFRCAGVVLPSRPRHFVDGCNVSFNQKPVCVAVSGSMAKRIANALDSYTPNRRGV